MILRYYLRANKSLYKGSITPEEIKEGRDELRLIKSGTYLVVPQNTFIVFC